MRLAYPLFALAALVLPSAVAAQDYERRSIRVDVSALDLSEPAGMDELARRIHRAVNRICAGDGDCRDEAWASTEDQVAGAIDRDVWMRRMAEARIAEGEACRRGGCDAPRLDYEPVFGPSPPAAGGVTVVIVHNPAPPAIDRY